MAAIWSWIQSHMEAVVAIFTAIIGLFTVKTVGVPGVAKLTVPLLRVTSLVTRDPRDQELINSLRSTIDAHKANKSSQPPAQPPVV